MGSRRAVTIAADPRTELVALFDTNTIQADQQRQRFGGEVYVDIDAVLRDPDIGVVFVCTPNDHHASAIVSAVLAGKYVFCEKPLARNSAEALHILKAAGNSSGNIRLAANLRHVAVIDLGHDLVISGAIGQPLYLRAAVGTPGHPASDWFLRAASAGGGTLLDNGSHVVDLMRWFMGEPVDCRGVTCTGSQDLEVEDVGFGLFHMSSGAIAAISSSWNNWGPYVQLEVGGTEGTLLIVHGRDGQRLELSSRNGGADSRDIHDDPLSSYRRELSRFIDIVQQGGTQEPGIFDAISTLHAIDALYLSAQLDEVIQISSGTAS